MESILFKRRQTRANMCGIRYRDRGAIQHCVHMSDLISSSVCPDVRVLIY